MSSIHAFQEALRQSPENVPLLLLYGRACLEELHIEDAVSAFERAVELDPRNTDAQLGLARALVFSGDSSKAAVRAELVLQQEPQNAAAHLLLSRVFLGEGDKQRARQHFDRAAQLDSSVSDAGLERELGRSFQEVRRVQQSGPMGDFSLSSNESGAVPSGDHPSDGEDDSFIDEPPYDWRPESFLMVGDPEREGLNFDDIGGLEEIKEEICRKIVHPLQQPDLHRAYGQEAGGALLLYGPPGCGKTLLLKAVAGEVPCNYLSVGLHEIFDPYFGSTERNLHQMFETARINAPCVLVIDGLDSLAQDRRHIRESQLRNVVNQLLHEMDGLRSDNERVLILAATSQPWGIDPALLRPGRFEQALFVPPPDADTRRLIFRRLAGRIPVGQIDEQALVVATEGFSGADLVYVMNRAAELTLAETLRSGEARPVEGDCILAVAKSHQPTTREWFEGVQAAGSDAVQDASWMSGEVRKLLADTLGKR